jgi:hypothetical protein
MAQRVQTRADVVKRSEDRLGELTAKFFCPAFCVLCDLLRLFDFFSYLCAFAALREIFDFLRYSLL